MNPTFAMTEAADRSLSRIMENVFPTACGEPPAYLEHSDLRAMFHWLLDRLDQHAPELRSKTLSRPVNAKHFGTLFAPAAPDDDIVLWELLRRCQRDGLIRIHSERKRRDPNLPGWMGTRIIFELEHEPTLRKWFNRPLVTDEARRWQSAVEKWAHAFKRIDLLARPVFAELEKPPEEILSRLAAIPALVADHPLSTYQVSSRLFWGASKVLRGREAWLRELLGLPESALVERMLPVEVAFPCPAPAGILMLENLDSYFSAGNGNWPDCHDFIKVYTQGFRGAAARIRNPNCAQLHFSDQTLPDTARLAAFRIAWFQGGPFSCPVYFCGDMDWSGLSIFRALKPIFPGLKPWKTGYARMLQAAQEGCWHSLGMAGKIGQIPLDTCHDDWLDAHVLAFLKANHRFVDQEVIG
jgi:hypothetical protein